MKQEKVWIVLGDSESSDHYWAVFRKKPTEDQLKALVQDWDYDPEEPGPGDFGSYVYLTVEQVDLL